ncbi:unnamed protein product [Prorocentrum cordatum]|uniref:At4g15545-like C-terminal domain-containing protein n=1 Tax=Prorocentrum cordatum TaxID=2364126 RepID=A0ABN9RB12_9DINO|nr:unnamed protein product [Polarella glacialis]
MGPKAEPGFVVCTGCRYRWNFRKNAKCWLCGIGLELAPAKPSPRGGVWADGGGGGGSQLAHRGGGGGGPPKDGAKGGKGGKGRGAASRGGGGGGAGGRGGGAFPKAPWSTPPESELDALLACGGPAIAARLQEAVRDARGYVAPAVAPAPKPLEQRLQSATAKRINLQRQLDEAADALVAAEDHLAECRGWRDEAAVNLADAKEEENALLRQRAQAAGVVGAQPDGARQLTFNFDAESFDTFAELEEEAQATLRRLCDEGLQIMQGAQATFERNCQEHQQRIKRQIEEEVAKKRKRTEEGPAAAVAPGTPEQGADMRPPLLPPPPPPRALRQELGPPRRQPWRAERQARRPASALPTRRPLRRPLHLLLALLLAVARPAGSTLLPGGGPDSAAPPAEEAEAAAPSRSVVAAAPSGGLHAHLAANEQADAFEEFFEAAELHLIDQFGISEGERYQGRAKARDAARYAAEFEVQAAESGMRDSWPISSLELVDLTPYMAAEIDGEADYLYTAAAEPAPGTGGFSPPKSQSQGRGEFGMMHDAEVRAADDGEVQASAADGGPRLATAAALAAAAAAGASSSRPSPARRRPASAETPAEVLRRVAQRRAQEQPRRREAPAPAPSPRLAAAAAAGSGPAPAEGHGAEEQALEAAPVPAQRQPAAAPPPPPAAGAGSQVAALPSAAAPQRLAAAAPRAEDAEPRRFRPGLEGVLRAHGFADAAAARERGRAARAAASRAGGEGTLPHDHEDQMNLGIRIITNAYQGKTQTLQQEIRGLQVRCDEQRANVGSLQKRSSTLEVELVESRQRHQQLAEENKELRKTVDTLDKQITRLDALRKQVLQSIQNDNTDAAQLGETSHLMSDEYLRNATPITSAECGFGGAAAPPRGRAPAALGGHDSVAALDGSQRLGIEQGAPPPSAPDGKQFFRQARSQLSYEAFNLFLSSIKRLNNQQQTREETLDEARKIFGPELSGLYRDFEALLTSHGM